MRHIAVTSHRRSLARQGLLVLHALIGITIGGLIGGGMTTGDAGTGPVDAPSTGLARAATPPTNHQSVAVEPAGTADANGRSTCRQCHIGSKKPVADYTANPECRECHLPPSASSRMTGTPSFAAITSRDGAGRSARPGSPAPAEVTPPTGQKIVKQRMVLIPAGPFWMGNNGRGADGPGDKDEQPLHKVSIGAYFIDVYETTNAMYKEFVDATKHEAPKLWKNGRYPPAKANHPVVYVSWHDASEFCAWAGKRLPTEQEWEKAARGTDKRVFPWGSQFDVMKANTPQYWMAIHQTETADTMPVGSFEAGKSPYGLYDMAGNVYEWVNDWYLPYPGNQYPNNHYGEKNKIVRGGSWYDCLSYGCGLSSPTYNRSRFNPDIRNKGFGFRCAKSVVHHALRTTSHPARVSQ
jgi:formylglycine-generating enzyme required for sulfatase activity